MIKKKSHLLLIIIISFLISILLIVIKLKFSNYLPIIFGLAFYPYLIYKWMAVAFESSSYIKKYHVDFYNKHKSFTNSFDGKMVHLTSFSNSELEKLNDLKILEFKDEITKKTNLMFFCFLGFGFLGVLTVLFA